PFLFRCQYSFPCMHRKIWLTQKLCLYNYAQLYSDDKYNGTLLANINTIDGLNELLKVSNFYDKLPEERHSSFSKNKNITDLVDKTKAYRIKQFYDLNTDQQINIKRLNRLLLEETYPQQTPKSLNDIDIKRLNRLVLEAACPKLPKLNEEIIYYHALNQILKDTALYDKYEIKHKEVNSAVFIQSLISDTQDYRSGNFSVLEESQRKNIISLNRLILEKIYPDDCPKWNDKVKAVLDTISLINLAEYPSIDKIGSDTNSPISVKTIENKYRLNFNYSTNLGNGTYGLKIQAYTNLNELIEPLVDRNIFNEILIVNQENGEVDFSLASLPLIYTELQTLTNKEGVEIKFSSLNPPDSLCNVRLANAIYNIYLQPVPFSLTSGVHLKDRSTIKWVVCGLIRTDLFNWEGMAISPNLMVVFIILIVFVFLSLPLIKLWLMGPNDRLKISDIYCLSLSILFGSAFLTIALLDTYAQYKIRKDVDNQLEILSKDIHNNFKEELGRSLTTLNQLNRKEALDRAIDALKIKKTDSSATNVLENIITKDDFYPYFDVVAWLDSRGWQRIKWSISEQQTAFSKLKDRDYFIKVADKQQLYKIKYNILYFYEDEFNKSLTIEALCSAINDNKAKQLRFSMLNPVNTGDLSGISRKIEAFGYKYNVSLHAISNSIEGLNKLLEVPNFYDTLSTRTRINFSNSTKELCNKTQKYRNKHFSNLNTDELINIRKLNRQVLEEAYPGKSPTNHNESFTFYLETVDSKNLGKNIAMISMGMPENKNKDKYKIDIDMIKKESAPTVADKVTKKVKNLLTWCMPGLIVEVASRLQPMIVPIDDEKDADKNRGTEKENYLAVASMGTRFLSLYQTVLPSSYGYCIINNSDGKVLFHKEEAKNSHENFFAECDFNKKIRSLVYSRSSDYIDGRYYGRDYRFYVRPVEDLPWSLIVYQDKELLRILNLDILINSFVLFYLYMLVPCIAFGFIYLITVLCKSLSGRASHKTVLYGNACWLWPGTLCANSYIKLLFCNFFLSASLYGVNWFYHQWHIIILPIIILFIETALVYLWSKKGFISENKTNNPSSENSRFHRKYIFTIVPLVIIIAVIPMHIFFKIAYNEEMKRFVKHGQIHLANKLENRTERIMSQYNKIIIGTNEKRKKEFLDKRIGKKWDTYCDCFFETSFSESKPQNSFDNTADIESYFNRFFNLINPLYIRYGLIDAESSMLSSDTSTEKSQHWKQEPEGKLTFCKLNDKNDSVFKMCSVLPIFGSPQNHLWWIGILFIIVCFIILLFVVRFVVQRVFLVDLHKPSAYSKKKLQKELP
ncbi:MAG: hypothetical protein HW406_1821, partial [Candidatus Brocadiaceae bacterium]|nr:hypothetical protein [Candidatus Brocadiaceae bacterium]